MIRASGLSYLSLQSVEPIGTEETRNWIKGWPLIRIFLIAVVIKAFVMGCTPTSGPIEPVDSNPLPVHELGFELEEGGIENYAEPLPNKQNIHVTWHYSDGTSKRVLAYRGWDFNKDGRIDMLEVLALDGTPEAIAFDFDGDGVIDMLKKREKNEFDISHAVNMPSAPETTFLAH